MADPLQSSSGALPELDRAGWARLGTIAQATQTALAAQKIPEESADRSRTTNGLAQFGIALWDTLKRDWHRLFHPLEGLRERLANSAEGPTAYREPSNATVDTRAETKAQAKAEPRSPLETTWTQVRDQLFEAARNPQADPQKVASQIVDTIPADHRQAMVERLGWLAEMAQTTAKTLEQVEAKAQAKAETKAETKVEAKARATGQTPTRAKAQRQVPPQPLPTAKPKRSAPTQAPTPTPTRAKAR